MSSRPRCIVASSDLPTVDYSPSDRVGGRIRPLSDAAGLTQMGVKVREISPGMAGSHLHFHDSEEEWSYVLSGQGRLRLGPLSLSVRASDFVALPPGPRPHQLIAEGGETLVLLEGGERRPEDVRTYPELRLLVRDGADEAIDPSSLPDYEGDERQLAHLEDVEERARPHALTPEAIRYQRAIDEATGMRRQACSWVRLEAGVESTTFHTHERTDEWVYLLSGEAELRLGEGEHRVAAGDFVGHPAKGPAHVLRALTEITYLMGGQHIPDDVVVYPDLGKRLTAAGFEDVPS